jgi:hypothetical protein
MLMPVPHVRSVVDQDGTVILDIKHDAMLTLNATGSYIWDKLQQGQLIEEIIRDLSLDTGRDIALVERDVHEFLEQLKAKHVVAQVDQQQSSVIRRRLSRTP